MKIALGMSGGVDSAVSAVLLQEAGHDVTGVFLECWRAPGCRAAQDRQDALKVALDRGIPFQVLDFRDAYKQKVVDIFFADYARGLTPNPDIWCNTVIKFGLFYDWAMAEGFEAIATGHYAQIGEQGAEEMAEPTGARVGENMPNTGQNAVNEIVKNDNLAWSYHPSISEYRPQGLTLNRSADDKKDQTYFLYRTRQDQLQHIVFPIGHLTKKQVRALAQEKNLAVADKLDSQGICFIGDINVRDFLREHLGEKPGDVVDTNGQVIGRHSGIWFYTIGQRHGFELFPAIHSQEAGWQHVLPPLYVVDKDATRNVLTVGYGAETMQDEVHLADVFVRQPQVRHSLDSLKTKVRVRHTGSLYLADLTWLDADHSTAKIKLPEPQRGLAAGQSVVFYDAADDRICWGGGVIV